MLFCIWRYGRPPHPCLCRPCRWYRSRRIARRRFWGLILGLQGSVCSPESVKGGHCQCSRTECGLHWLLYGLSFYYVGMKDRQEGDVLPLVRWMFWTWIRPDASMWLLQHRSSTNHPYSMARRSTYTYREHNPKYLKTICQRQLQRIWPRHWESLRRFPLSSISPLTSIILSKRHHRPISCY